jgi:signal transduction histidine kinase
MVLIMGFYNDFMLVFLSIPLMILLGDYYLFGLVALLSIVLMRPEVAEYQMIVTLVSVLYYHLSYRLEKDKDHLINLLEKKENKLDRLYDKQLASVEYDTHVEETTRLEERTSIAQALHDELGHTLSGSTLQLEAVQLVMDNDPEKAKVMIDVVIENLRSGTDDIRKILKKIKPERASFNIQSIKSMALDVKKKSGIHIDILYDQDINNLSIKEWAVVSMNLKECFTNMMKYSKCSQCTIQFVKMNKLFKISFADNGIGSTMINHGMGLKGMEERLQTIHGDLIVDGQNGFSVVQLIHIGRDDD